MENKTFHTSAEYLKRKRTVRRANLIRMNGGKCIKCGYSKSDYAFDFHHRNPKEKHFKLSGINLTKYSWDTILFEAVKCDLLCKNCHAEIKQT